MKWEDEILAGESYSLEFKLVPNEGRINTCKAVVAFANGRGGRILFGGVFIGASDVCCRMPGPQEIRSATTECLSYLMVSGRIDGVRRNCP